MEKSFCMNKTNLQRILLIKNLLLNSFIQIKQFYK